MTAGSDSRTGPAAPPSWVRARGDVLVLDVHAQPGARRDAVVGAHGERLKIAVSAPASDGKANAALAAVIAARLGVPARAIRLVHGASGRDKRFEVSAPGLTPVAAACLLLDEGRTAPRAHKEQAGP